MKRAAAILVLLSFFSVLGSGQDQPNFFSDGLMNGRFWMVLNERQKLLYLQGYRDGLSVGARGTDANKLMQAVQPMFPLNLPTGDTLKGVDKFFSERENWRFPIIYAVRIFAMKVAGTSQKDIDAQIDRIRKQFP